MEAGQSLREQGIQALREDALDRALDLLARAVMADGRDAEAKANLAVVYSRKALHAQARRTIQNALELQPSNPDFRHMCGTILEREGDTNAAAAAYRECLRRDPRHAEAAARLELMGVSPLQPDPEPAPAPAITPPPPAAPPRATGPQRPSFSKPRSAEEVAVAGNNALQCPRCLEWSSPGISCEWCAGPLMQRPQQPAYVPPPYAPPVYAPPGYAPQAPGAYPPAAYQAYPPGGYAAGGPFPNHLLGYRRANRGGTILSLGILGLLFTLFFFCPVFPLAGLVMSIMAWTMGNSDIAEMDAGTMDDRGRGQVSSGRTLGILGTGLAVLQVLAVLIFLSLAA